MINMGQKSKYRCLLALNVYELTLGEIAELKRPRHAGAPQWGISDTSGIVLPSDYYHQFTTPESADHGEYDNDVRKFVLFDIMHASPILEEEINNAGFDGVFDKVDLRQMFAEMPKQSYEDMLKRIPICEYVVVDVTYESYGLDDEYDVFIDVIGYLDGNMAIRETKTIKIEKQ